MTRIADEKVWTNLGDTFAAQFTGPTDERIPIVERWRAIPGMRIYEVSNTGKVRNAGSGRVLKENAGCVYLKKDGFRRGQRYNVLTLLDRAWREP